jgi:hypothetical protein
MLLLILGISAGCRQTAPSSNPNVQIKLEWGATAPSVGADTLRVIVTDANNQPINVTQVAVRGDMSHAGMQPELYTLTNGTQGVYETPFNWTMAGDWFVEITVTLPDGGTAQERFEYTVEG